MSHRANRQTRHRLGQLDQIGQTSMVPRTSAFAPEPANVESGVTRYRDTALDTNPVTEMMQQMGDRDTYFLFEISKLKRQMNERDEDIENLKQQMNERDEDLEDFERIFKSDLRTLDRRVDSQTQRSGHSSTQLVNRTAQLAPSEGPSHALSGENFPQQAGPPSRSIGPRHFKVETQEAFVEVFLSQVDSFQGSHERVDSGFGSPQRAPTTPADHVCCGNKFLNQADLVKHVFTHVKPKETPSTAATPRSWLPAAVSDVPPFPISEAVAHHKETFTWSFLHEELGGEEWSPGYHFNGRRDCKPPFSRGYWLVELEHEPCMPRIPGEHGAKITPFLHDPIGHHSPDPNEDYTNTPVFVCAQGSKSYQYLGNYSQVRWSDKIGYDTLMEHIPESVRQYHAEQLTRVGRPKWVTERLQDHFWPQPKYEGPLPTDSACQTRKTSASTEGSNGGLERCVVAGLAEWAEIMKKQKKESERVDFLDVRNIHESFNKEDIADQPALRPWWEYMQCTGYDEGLYEFLVKRKHDAAKASNPRISIGRNPTPTFAKIQQNGEQASKDGATSSAKDSRGARYQEVTTWDDKPEYKPVPNPVYGAAAKKLQRQLEREYPGVDTSNATTKFVTFDFNAEGPVEHTIVGQSGVKKSVEKAEIPKSTVAREPGWIPPHLRKKNSAPVPTASNTTQVEKETTLKQTLVKVIKEERDKQESSEKGSIFKQSIDSEAKQTTEKGSIGKQSSTTPSENQIGKQKVEEPVNPFLQTGKANLDEAKSFAQNATTATRKTKGKTVAPHLRGK